MSTSQSARNTAGEIDVENLKAFLLQRGCSSQIKVGLQVTPAEKGSGFADTAIHHDRVIVEQQSGQQS